MLDLPLVGNERGRCRCNLSRRRARPVPTRPGSTFGLGDHAAAYELLEQGLAVQREIGNRYLSDTLDALGRATWTLGRATEAEAHFRDSLALARVQGARWEAAFCLEGLAAIDLAAGRAGRAARLLAAAAALRTELGSALSPAERADFESKVAAARAALDEAGFAAALAGGRTMTLEQAIDDALTGGPPHRPPTALRRRRGPSGNAIG